MNKQTLWFCLAGIGVVLLGLGIMSRNQSFTSGASASETPEAAAQRQLPELISLIQGDAKGFGFKDAQEVNSITLSRPYQLYQPRYENVEKYRPGMQAADLFTPTQDWQFVVLLNGQPKGLTLLVVSVRRLQGRCAHRAKSFGVSSTP